MNYHIGRLFLSSFYVGAFGAAGIWWCSFCKLQSTKRTPPNTNRNKSSNTQRTENKTTDVVTHQHSRKLLKMDILMSETWWAHNKWNKIASDIKLVFHSSTSWSYSKNACFIGTKVPFQGWPLIIKRNISDSYQASDRTLYIRHQSSLKPMSSQNRQKFVEMLFSETQTSVRLIGISKRDPRKLRLVS